MSDFKKFRDVVAHRLEKMSKDGLFHMDLDKDAMWNTYLNSFPEGTNLMFRERREYDCSCCRQFIKAVGHVVTIKDGKVESLWDNIPEIAYYGPVVKALSEFVKSHQIGGMFYHDAATVGTAKNIEIGSNGSMTWNHFSGKLAPVVVKSRIHIPTITGIQNAQHGVFVRSLKELSLDAVETVLELIAQNSLYRGSDYKGVVESFRKHKIESTKSKDVVLYAWEHFQNIGAIRNTAIGTLLVDLSEGVDLERAVRKFEAMVAPANYKRPKALITQRMIEDAQKTIVQLGIEDSLARRFAKPDDITVNNLLFVDRSSKVLKDKGVFDLMKEEVAVAKRPKASKVQEISLDVFINQVLPTTQSVELLFERNMTNNLMSLIAPTHAAAPNILKWDNNFSWSYMGEMADSVKERVKAAGGRVDGKLRVSLGWGNRDDLDLHVHDPTGDHIYFGNKSSRRTDGKLDVDMHAFGGYVDNPVENVIWPNHPKRGSYTVEVNNYAYRDSDRTGYRLEVECGGELFVVEKSNNPRNKGTDTYEFQFDGERVTPGKSFASDNAPGEPIWGIRPNTYVPVDMVMFSPNYWDDNAVGNKQVFFMVKDCQNEDTARGFYNEFLKEDLNKHRKVFEVLASKMKPDLTDDQLSGFGFSTTARAELTVKVKGAHERILKVKI